MYFEMNTDGSKYLYAWQDKIAPSELTIVERDLQTERERTVYQKKPVGPDDRFRGLRFSPDRRSLSFRGSDGIYVLDLDSSRVRIVHDEVPGEPALKGAPPEGPTWSASGRSLLAPRIENRETDRRDTEFRLIPTDGGAVRKVPFASGLVRLLSSKPGSPRPSIQSVVWSPDGSRLALTLRASRVVSFMIDDPPALAGAAK
jgi:Tol biopolymer transport system component